MLASCDDNVMKNKLDNTPNCTFFTLIIFTSGFRSHPSIQSLYTAHIREQTAVSDLQRLSFSSIQRRRLHGYARFYLSWCACMTHSSDNRFPALLSMFFRVSIFPFLFVDRGRDDFSGVGPFVDVLSRRPGRPNLQLP